MVRFYRMTLKFGMFSKKSNMNDVIIMKSWALLPVLQMCFTGTVRIL